jgi:RNA polymerase sigma-70 factor (ECF subfamily)
VSDAEDIVQESFLRWSRAERSDVIEPRGYLTRVVTRLCIDHLASARVRRERYVGTWLPEPALTSEPAELARELSMALLLALERLSPLERAAFLLHDVFDVSYPEVARALERSEDACRQLAARAREHVRADRPRFEATPEAVQRILGAFHRAIESGDTALLSDVLAEDAVFYSDGGGKRVAALRPIHGRAKITRLFAGMARRNGPFSGQVERARVCGEPGLVLRGRAEAGGIETIALEIVGEHVRAIYLVRNPDKVQHLS